TGARPDAARRKHLDLVDDVLRKSGSIRTATLVLAGIDEVHFCGKRECRPGLHARNPIPVGHESGSELVEMRYDRVTLLARDLVLVGEDRNGNRRRGPD